MGIKTIPLKRLEENLREQLNECADSGEPIVVELPDTRLVAIQALDPTDDDSLVDDLIESNPAFRELLTKSKSSARRAFTRTARDEKRD